MAGYPSRLHELPEYYNLDICEIYVTCVFCNNLLTLDDTLNFEKADLNLVWRHGWPYGCCQACCKKAGFCEFMRYYQLSVSGDAIESVTGKTLLQLQIRCFGCLCPLDLATKLEHAWNKYPFHFVQNRWKGCCGDCRNAWASTQHP